MTTAAALATGLPFLAAVLGLAFGRRFPAAARALATLPLAASVLLTWAVAVRHDSGGVTEHGTELTPTGALDITLSMRVDGLSAIVAALVATVALLVQVYSAAYMRKDPRYSSYAALISLFSAAMLLVVYTGDLIVLLVGWEVMGVCSYFLIGHYWETEVARAAAVKAFLVTKLGDVPFLIGVLVLGVGAGSFRIGAIVDGVPPGGAGWATAGTLLMLGGVAGKSAQVPLQTWLPDAMTGPTPVSALIHAATMVAAGAYVVARLYPVFLASDATLVVLAVMAALTMVSSALFAFAQDDLKRVLAWSTVSQLAYMTGGLAAGGRDAAVFHLLTHGAFKALLFLAAGVVIHLAGTGRISDMGGLRRREPLVFWTMTAGLGALVGVPPLSGFFSKEAVLGAAEHTAIDGGAGAPPAVTGWLVIVAGVLTAGLTAAYATRLWLRVFFGEARKPAPEPHGPTPVLMLWPLAVLTVPTVLLGVIGLNESWLPAWLGDADGRAYGSADAANGLLLQAPAYYDLAPRLGTSLAAVALLALGAGAVYALWRRDPAADPARVLGRLRGPAERGFDVDRLYDAVVVRPVWLAARATRFVDRVVIDGYVHAAAQGTWLAGGGVRRSQNGNVQVYLAGVLAGFVVLAVTVAVRA
ncbi:NADH-quinone oxidoreductase subunit L [Yinghuangia seranimata]|uniref:NADH-quinone oxidoreductase subunit 5 family protein n=1 Tax=Yinghuangia seranimata TaxID=408067 RepID=UPI00248B0333|nr:NADH-quinone oxidoreductase subunit L [Yinghuangia seranimata]MDI2126960.1 NADH-quinone oxidoreductase subunit L [Yinghuangia seranimata]